MYVPLHCNATSERDTAQIVLMTDLRFAFLYRYQTSARCTYNCHRFMHVCYTVYVCTSVRARTNDYKSLGGIIKVTSRS